MSAFSFSLRGQSQSDTRIILAKNTIEALLIGIRTSQHLSSPIQITCKPHRTKGGH